MTIDEAIEQEKFKARVDRIKANKRIFHNNDEDEISACNRSAEKHEQLVEWLEELKAIKEKGRYVQGFKAGYTVGVDDFMAKVSECFISDLEWDYLVQESERLKAGVVNE